MRYALTLEYKGTAFAGWQRQKNAIGVQEVVERALEVVFQQKIVLHASGRTDRGVHAEGQVAHFDSEKDISPEKIKMAVNTLLPVTVRVVKAERVSDEFHAQYSAKRKTYVYRAYVSRTLHPLKAEYAAQIVPPIDVEAMRVAAKKFIGVHDFSAFSSTGSAVKTTVREIYSLNIEFDGENITFTVEGNGFLYNMVRIIIGTLVFVGKGKIKSENIDLMLEGGERKLGGKTFPAEGLVLKEVKYL